MRNPFNPPSLYQNYQPPAPRSDFYMPVPGWGWPVDSAGSRRVGMGDVSSASSSALFGLVTVLALAGGVYAASKAR